MKTLDEIYQDWQFTKDNPGHNPHLAELQRLTWGAGVRTTDLFRAGWRAVTTPAMGMVFVIEANNGEEYIQVFCE